MSMHGEEQAPQSTNDVITITRHRRWVLAVLVIVVCVSAIVGAMMYRSLFQPVHLSQPEIVTVERETSFSFVAHSLQKRGLIPNALAFRIYARLTNHDGNLKIGEYEIENGARPVDILDILVSGRARTFKLTIPEGKWASEIGGILTGYWPDASSSFPTLIREPQRWESKVPFQLPQSSLEGYLFPDTYRFPTSATAEQIISKMLERFQVTCWAAYQKNPPEDGRSLRDVVILASLIEAEAKVDKERPIIAGVYMNRLANGWRLDCDATLIYAMQKRVTRVMSKDKLIDSPYNTYKRFGLPPGPINNPGLPSFLAALHPAKTPYYFYVARGDGSHIFSRTLQEQSAVIRRLRGNN